MIEFVMLMTAYRPDEHYLLTVKRVVVSGIQAINYAILDGWAHEPKANTFLIQISSTIFGSITAFFSAASKTGFNTGSIGVSF